MGRDAAAYSIDDGTTRVDFGNISPRISCGHIGSGCYSFEGYVFFIFHLSSFIFHLSAHRSSLVVLVFLCFGDTAFLQELLLLFREMYHVLASSFINNTL